MNQHFPLLPDGATPADYPIGSTLDENLIVAPIEMYEAFSASDARVEGFDFYGVQRVRIFQKDRVEVDCGYLRPGNCPDGPFTLSAPAKDAAGRNHLMKITFPDTAEWRVKLTGGEYKTGWQFTYVGKLNPEGTGFMELSPLLSDGSYGEPKRLPINL